MFGLTDSRFHSPAANGISSAPLPRSLINHTITAISSIENNKPRAKMSITSSTIISAIIDDTSCF